MHSRYDFERARSQAVNSLPVVIDRVPPFALVLGGVSSVQIGAALARTMFDDLGPSGTSLLRVFFAALALVLLWRPDPRRYTWNELRFALAFGLALGFMNLTFYLGLDRLDLGVAVTIEFIGPLAVAVFGSRRRLDLAWAALAAAGIVLLANPGGAESIDTLGLVFVLIAGACWAAYILIAQRAGRVFPGSQGVAMAMVVAAVIPIAPGIVDAGSALLRPELLASGCAVGVLSSAIPYSLETEALRRIPANVFGVLMSMEPAVAALAGFVVLGQDLGLREIVAVALVVAASAGVSLVTPPEA
jgi:inner membrane transporter RhtA